MSFPKEFVWGAAAAAYQVEGAPSADGKGQSVWDMFCRKPGVIHAGHTGDRACEHYQRFAEDVDLMQRVGLQAYRFSISWPRVLPNGTGKVNQAGLDFYDRLIDQLLANGIQPFVTLFHWDFPLELYRRGGWLNPDSPNWFADYSEVVVRALGDRVTHYMTLNEPQVFVGMGHLEGTHAPGDKLRLQDVLQIGHRALLAHGRSVQALRAAGSSKTRVGYAPMVMPRIPYQEIEADIEAARQATFVVRERNTWSVSWWMDPVFLGRYPEQAVDFFGGDAPVVGANDMAIIAEPVDFMGLNTYMGLPVTAGRDGSFEDVPFPDGFPHSAFNWPITPAALYWSPRYCYERYKKPIWITENGTSVRDWVGLDGKVRDPARIDYMTRYLRELHRAIADGVDVRGYLHWSIFDNFEWAEGYKERFGLVYVDYTSQERTLKDSAHFYRDVIDSNGARVLE